MDIIVGRLMTKDARFTNKLKSSIATTKAAFHMSNPWSETSS